jgi:anti-sigma regulatory factor (Ser/Thr protein kinase)
MTLLAYTDGLVERRGLDIDDGIARAADALRLRPERGAEDTADALLETFVQPRRPPDDVALFVLQLDDVPATFQVEIPADPLVVRELRARLKAWLARRGLTDEQTADTVLAVSEACNNAIEHGYGGDHGTIRITHRAPRRRAPDHGRGRRHLEGRALRPDARPGHADHEPDDGLGHGRVGADRDARRPRAAPAP